MQTVVPGSKIEVLYQHPLIGQISIANATEFELEIETDLIDQTNKDSQGWKEMIAGCRSWSISTTALYENFRFAGYMDMFQYQLENRNQVYLKFQVEQDLGKYYAANAQIVSLNLIGNNEEQATYQAFFVGNNKLIEYN
tara:strand:- start:7310 stop:7726 length:417 start_codon:yes stop_codon:yes gene_type:complete